MGQEYRRTNEEKKREEFRALLEEQIRGQVKAVLEEIMRAEMAEQLGALPYERTESRRGLRNGCYFRGLNTRVGRVVLKVPRDREGKFRTQVFDRYQRVEGSLEEMLVEAYIQGISTRRIQELTEALCDLRRSPSAQSRLNQRISEGLRQWRERPIVGQYPYLYLDGVVISMRWGQSVEKLAVLFAVGVSEEGYREVLGVFPGYIESEDSWREFLRSLVARELTGVRLVVSDNHVGIKKAVETVFPEAKTQRCMVHFMRNVLLRVPPRLRKEVGAALKAIFAQESAEEARVKAGRVVERYMKLLPASMKILMQGLEETLTYYSFPAGHWKKIRTTNCMERLIKEIRRRTKVVGAFPDEESCLLLVTARAKAQEQAWSQRRYLNMDLLKELDLEAAKEELAIS